MIQVRIFDCEHELDLEKLVNEFLETINMSDFIDVKYQISSLYDKVEQIYCYSAIVIYKENV